MAEVARPAPTAAPAAASGVSASVKPKRPSRAKRIAGVAAKAAGTAGSVLPSPWGKALAAAGKMAGTVLERKMGTPPVTEGPQAPGASPTSGSSTEDKLTALLSGGGASNVGGGAMPGAVAIGTKIIGGVAVSPTPYDSEVGPKLAVAARVFGSANALELAVSRLIDVDPGQLLTFVMNRGYR